MKFNPLHALFVAFMFMIIFFVSGCALLNPSSITRPVFKDSSAKSVFEVTKGGQQSTVGPDGRVTGTSIVPNDTLKVNNEFMTEGAVLGYQNAYFDPYKQAEFHYQALAQIGAAAMTKEGGATPAEITFLETVSAQGNLIQPAALLSSENVTLSRTSDPAQAADVAKEQFRAMQAVTTGQTNAASDVAKTGINAAFPASAVGQVVGAAAQIYKEREAQRLAQEAKVAPVAPAAPVSPAVAE